MGQEITTSEVRIKRFLGLNNKITDTSINIREAAALQNVNITEESLDQRNGSLRLNADPFLDNAGVNPVPITGMYEGILNGTRFRVGVGGDAFRELTGGAWVNRTGTLTITNDPDIHWSFATFLDGAATQIIIAANGVDAPIAWTGAGNAVALATPPGNFNYPVVHKNKLWVAVGNTLYFSELRDGETWDTLNDLSVFENSGEDIAGLYRYSDRIIVFQNSAIHVVSGSSNRDLFIETIVTGEGCASGASIQEIESRRYGNILIFLSSEGTYKGFNGSKNLIKLGDPIDPLFRAMNRGRYSQAVSMNYKRLGQYWLGITYGSGGENDQVLIYDYLRDAQTDPETGRPLSSNLYHTGISPNAMAIFTASDSEIPVTSDYDGYALQQDTGLLDENTSPINSIWQTGRLDFGSPSHVKLVSDLHIATTQTSATNMSLNVNCGRQTGTATLSIPVGGDVYGVGLYGTALYTAGGTSYTRARITPNPTTSERAMSGRYISFQFNHSDADESMRIEEMVIGVSDLGMQPEFV